MVDYTSKPKEIWRRWVWNRVAERINLSITGFKRSEAFGLYLVGPDDLDRPVAMEKGFLSLNLIAVECPQIQNLLMQNNGSK